jgi:ferredoxin--NADP+ reductase
MAKELTYNATLAERVDLTESLAIFKIAADQPIDDREWFAPGQYLVIGMNNAAQPELGAVRRAMSICSGTTERGPLEFYIRRVPQPESENPLTHLMWGLKVGDRLFMRVHATGKFTYRDTIGLDDSRFRLLVAAGTGAAPFVSVLRSAVLKDPDVDLSNTAFLHGVSYPHDLGYREEMSKYAANNGLHYLPTVSRPDEAPDWDGDRGRVEDFFLPERLPELERRLGKDEGSLNPTNAVVLVCALQGTIGACITRLVSRGFIPDHRKVRRVLDVSPEQPASLFYEQYDTVPVINVKDPEVVASLRAALEAARADGH